MTSELWLCKTSVWRVMSALPHYTDKNTLPLNVSAQNAQVMPLGRCISVLKSCLTWTLFVSTAALTAGWFYCATEKAQRSRYWLLAQNIVHRDHNCNSKIENRTKKCHKCVYSKRQMHFKYFSFMSVLKESEGFCSAQGKGIRWYGAPHLRQALQVTTAQGREGEFFFPPAKVFNLVKPEGLSRCLIIKGVWTKGYSKPAGATNWTFSSVFDGWLPSEIVCFPSLCLC